MARLYPLPVNLKVIFLFNVVAFTLWLFCFLRFLVLIPLVGTKFLPGGIADFFQTVAVLPLVSIILRKLLVKFKFTVRDLFGLANALKMVFICYVVIFPHPKIAKHITYSFLILSWCILYIIDFFYYSFRVKTRSSPYWLYYLKYTHFWVTLPVAAAAELAMIFLALTFVDEDLALEMVFKIVLLAYVPLNYWSWMYLSSKRNDKLNSVRRKQQQQNNIELQTTN